MFNILCQTKPLPRKFIIYTDHIFESQRETGNSFRVAIWLRSARRAIICRFLSALFAGTHLLLVMSKLSSGKWLLTLVNVLLRNVVSKPIHFESQNSEIFLVLCLLCCCFRFCCYSWFVFASRTKIILSLVEVQCSLWRPTGAVVCALKLHNAQRPSLQRVALMVSLKK